MQSERNNHKGSDRSIEYLIIVGVISLSLQYYVFFYILYIYYVSLKLDISFDIGVDFNNKNYLNETSIS